MKRLSTRALSLIISICMLITCMPIVPLATASGSVTYRDSGIEYKDNLAVLNANRERGWSASSWIDCTTGGATVKNPTGGIYSLFYNLACFSAGNSFTKSDYGSRANPRNSGRTVGGADIAISDEVLTSIGNTLENARANNTAVIIRFAYTRDQNTGYEPADFSTIEGHIEQLAPILNQYKDVVLSVEAGMIGPWGEMHSSKYTADSNGDDKVSTYVVRVLQAWLGQLDESISVQCRNIWGIIPFYNHTEASTFVANLDSIRNNPTFADDYQRLGMYNDGYLGTYGDYGTWDNQYDGSSGNRLLVRDDGIAYLNTVTGAPYGGELATVSNVQYLISKSSPIYNNGTDPYDSGSLCFTPGFIQELYSTHLTYLRKLQEDKLVLASELRNLYIDASNPLDQAMGIDMTWYDGMSYKDFMWNNMGYRIVVTGAETSDTAAPGGTLTLRGSLQNVGFGNFLRDRVTEIVLSNGSTTYTAAASFDPDTLVSTAEEDYDLTFLLPADMPTGEWTAYMRIKNADYSDATGIAFANNRQGTNTSIYNSTLHANYIGTVTVSGSAVSDNDAFYEEGTATPSPEPIEGADWATGLVTEPLEVVGPNRGTVTRNPDEFVPVTLVIKVEGASVENPVTVGGLSCLFAYDASGTIKQSRAAYSWHLKHYNSVNQEEQEFLPLVQTTEDGIFICQFGDHILTESKRVTEISELYLNNPLGDYTKFVAASEDAGGQAMVSAYFINGDFSATVRFHDGETLLDTQTVTRETTGTTVRTEAAPRLADIYDGAELPDDFLYWADEDGNQVEYLAENMDVYMVRGVTPFTRTDWVTGPVSQPLEIAGPNMGTLVRDPEVYSPVTLLIKVTGASEQNPVTVGGLSYVYDYDDNGTTKSYRAAYEYFMKMYNSVNGDGEAPYKPVLDAVTEDGVYIARYGSHVFCSDHHVLGVTEFYLNKPDQAFVANSSDASGEATISVAYINGDFDATVRFYDQDGTTLLDTQNYSLVTTKYTVASQAAPKLTDLYNGAALPANFAYWADEDGNRVDYLTGDVNVHAVCAEIKLSSIAVQILNGIGINIKANKAYLEQYGYTDPYVTVTFDGKTYTLAEPTEKDGMLCFLFREFGPQAMGDDITATISGGGYTSEPKTFSIRSYCEYLMENYSGTVYNLAVDILNYGAQCQRYTKYRPDDMVNAGLTPEEQSRWQDTDLDGVVSVKDIVDSSAANPTVTWKSATLHFQNTVDLKVKVNPTDEQDIKLKVVMKGATFWITDCEIASDGVRAYTFDRINPTAFGTPIRFTVCRADGTEISRTVVYSVNSYIRNKLDENSSEKLCNMLRALRQYSLSLTEYVDSFN